MKFPERAGARYFIASAIFVFCVAKSTILGSIRFHDAKWIDTRTRAFVIGASKVAKFVIFPAKARFTRKLPDAATARPPAIWKE